MNKILRTGILLLMVCICYGVSGQTFPGEGSLLNYRIIGFSFKAEPKASMYRLEVAKGHHTDNTSFIKNRVTQQTANGNRIISEVPDFGSGYTWRVVYLAGKKELSESKLFHFALGNSPNTDTSIQRLRILSRSPEIKDKYFFSDGPGVLYDYNGRPVWYLPTYKENEINYPTDLKITNEGTITLLSNNRAYEIDYNGNILWRSPKIMTEDSGLYIYHHDFMKLSKGNYMALMSTEYQGKTGLKDPNEGKRFFPNVENGQLVELNKEGKIIWSWATAAYFTGSDLSQLFPHNGSYNIDFHENAFSFNEQDSIIYLSLNGFSRILKMKYPSGEVVSTYGNLYSGGVNNGASLSNEQFLDIQYSLSSNYLFCKQHSCKAAKDGSIYVYNNNMQRVNRSVAAIGRKKITPQVLKLKESAADHNKLTTVWTYNCVPPEEQKMVSGGGGNLAELADGSLFIAMNAPYSKLFILNSEQKNLWTGILEKKKTGNIWENAPCYRSSIIDSREKMERLVWYQWTKPTNRIN